MTDLDLAVLDQSVVRYASWLDSHPRLGAALCWTSVRTAAEPESILGLISSDWMREGVVDLSELDESSYDDGSGREHVAWFVGTGEHVALLEINGFGGSQLGGLQALAESVPAVAGMFWNANMVNQLSVGREGRLVTAELWAEKDLSEESPLISAYQPALTSHADLRAFGLAVVENESGLRLDDDVLQKRWPLVRFAGREDTVATSHDEEDRADVELFDAMATTTERNFVAAKARSARSAAQATGIDSEPCIVAVIAAIAAGQQLAHDGELTRELNRLSLLTNELLDASTYKPGDLMDPLWRRLQACEAIEWLSRVERTNEYGDEDADDPEIAEVLANVWRHVGWAIGEDQWPGLQRQLRQLIT